METPSYTAQMQARKYHRGVRKALERAIVAGLSREEELRVRQWLTRNATRGRDERPSVHGLRP